MKTSLNAIVAVNYLKAEWMKARKALTEEEWIFASEIVKKNIFVEEEISKLPKKISKFLAFYLVSRDAIKTLPQETKEQYIREFEASCASEVSEMCRDLLRG